jgi:hypothetical protein
MHVRALIVIVASIIELWAMAPVLAAPPSEAVQTGEIAIEDTQEERRDPRERIQGHVGAWLGGMTKYATNGGVGDVVPLGEDDTTYLSVLYLYCLNKFGPCPFILDVILESDVRDSRATGEPACPTMSRFWKTWLASDLEGRSKYLLSIGSGTAVADFNARERSKYIQCKPTIRAVLADPGAQKARYGAEGTVTAAVSKTAKLLEEIKAKEIDIYRAVGLTN